MPFDLPFRATTSHRSRRTVEGKSRVYFGKVKMRSNLHRSVSLVFNAESG